MHDRLDTPPIRAILDGNHDACDEGSAEKALSVLVGWGGAEGGDEGAQDHSANPI